MSSLDITITIIITIIIKSGYFSVIGHLSYCPVLHKFLEVIFDDTGKGSLCNSLSLEVLSVLNMWAHFFLLFRDNSQLKQSIAPGCVGFRMCSDFTGRLSNGGDVENLDLPFTLAGTQGNCNIPLS